MQRQIVTRTRYGGMEYSDVRERPAWTRRAARPGFEPTASKLRRPLTRPGTIIRSSLVGRLTRDDLRPIVSLVAPSGYGKTTLLSQWAVLKRRPDLGTLAGEAQALRSQLAKERAPGVAGASSLTAAELRVLPLLATHLSFPEIGAEMFLSPHTVKSQAISIYRKLGASSRDQAVTRARELGLLEG